MKRKSFDGPGPEELFDVSNTLFENSGLKMDEMRRRATEADKFTTLGGSPEIFLLYLVEFLPL